MKVATVAIAYNESRFIKPHLEHVPDWVDENLVLVSTKPWQGSPEPNDGTSDIARSCGATVIEYDWATEQEQRNAGQEYLAGYDWIIVLDPDEFFDNAAWEYMRKLLEDGQLERDAYVTGKQLTYWKSGYRIDPPEDYTQIVLVRPSVRFFDKRCVDAPWGRLYTTLHHMSWARTDAECLSKITHYAHAHELNKDWYKNVWLADKRENVHPLTPESLKRVVPVKLPPELEVLNLWPSN